MTGFPWDIAIGLGIVLLGTLAIIAWVLMYDHLEAKDATKKGIQSENRWEKH
jgi:hypothetical protein